MTTWNTQRAGFELVRNLPENKHETMKGKKEFKPRDTWLIQEASMQHWSSHYYTQSKIV